jgi:hypothetical protein
LVGSCLALSTWAQDSDVPLVVPLNEVKMEIKEINYLEQVEGLKVQADKRDKYRIALVTIQFTKPAGRAIEVAAADLTLHYTHGGEAEVAPCEGISSFNQTLSEDRAMKMFNQSGPGWIKQRTAVRATQATVVYMDAAFALIEPDISDVWLCVGQPVQIRTFKTPGWKP